MSRRLNPRFSTGAPMTHYKNILLFIVGILCAFPTYAMNDKVDEHSKKLLDVSFYNTHENNEELLKTILANKADPNIHDKNFVKYNPLHRAVSSEHPTYVSILLSAGANPNIQGCFGERPLDDAAYTGKIGSIQLLLNNKANLSLTDPWGNTPLHKAIHVEGNPQAVELLLSAKANPNFKSLLGNTPLHKAAYEATHEARRKYAKPRMFIIVQLLLQYGADINIINHEGFTALQLRSKDLNDPIARKMGRLLVWHSILLREFTKLVPNLIPETVIAYIIASHAAAICAEEPTIWEKRLLPAAPALTLAAPSLTNEQSYSLCQLI